MLSETKSTRLTGVPAKVIFKVTSLGMIFILIKSKIEFFQYGMLSILFTQYSLIHWYSPIDPQLRIIFWISIIA